MAEDVKFEKIRQIGIISSTKNSSYEFNVVKWGDRKPKYDIRKWGDKGKTPYRGASFSKDEMYKIHMILSENLKRDRVLNEPKTYEYGTLKVMIYEVLGEYRKTSQMKGLVTFSSWSNKPKYDIRMWSEDFLTCKKGVTFNERECELLLSLLKMELEKDNSNSQNFDTKDIDDLLL